MKFKKGDYVVLCLGFIEIVGIVHSFNKKHKEYNIVYLEKKDVMEVVNGVPEDMLVLTSPALAELYDF
jgi:hypothetical protein